MGPEVQTVDPAAAPPAARILIVDDERSMREMLAILLRREGHDVAIAENGRRALDYAVAAGRWPEAEGRSCGSP